ncbi:MAG: PEP-CTERM sorting domain-containing protein [Phycisphaerales bacterium]|nr:PEP-CTERM sorting domain-containing protein [Phycisphaerales bacterium]MCI0675094.1 PEP-CTERM sorting domain-containing protein [Phycisphaerales bacterium]
MLAVAGVATAILSTSSALADTASGGGGTIIGSGGGSWVNLPAGATILPGGPASNTSSIVLPVGVASINSITITGLTHTWIGDTHAVLIDPTGAMHNIYVRPGLFNTSVFGNSGDFLGGTYTFVDSGGLSLPTSSSPIVSPPAGTYNTTDGGSPDPEANWVNGNLGIFNTPFASISGAAGTWSLRFYDWDPADSGTFTGWELNYNAIPAPGALALLGLAGVVGSRRRRR